MCFDERYEDGDLGPLPHFMRIVFGGVLLSDGGGTRLTLRGWGCGMGVFQMSFETKLETALVT